MSVIDKSLQVGKKSCALLLDKFCSYDLSYVVSRFITMILWPSLGKAYNEGAEDDS